MAEIIAGSDPAAAGLISACLVNRGIVVMRCDTIYGIHGCAPDTLGKLRGIKGRGEEKPFITLLPTVASIVELAEDDIPDVVLELLPGPLTLIVRTNEGRSGLRVPADDFLLRILEQTGPLFSTSVNLAGQPALWRFGDICRTFDRRVDMIVDSGDLEDKIPSTILDISGKPFTLVRAGAVTLTPEILRLCAK
jgi:L-threonylcarbamoyladenylate synthase